MSRPEPAPRASLLRSFALVLFALPACSPSTTAGDAANEAGLEASVVEDTTATDASDVAPPPADAPRCELGAEPSPLASQRGSIVVLGEGDAGTSFPSGGPITEGQGTWVATGSTLYLPAAARGLVDTSMSGLTGTAWLGIDASSFRLALALELMLTTNVVGAITRPVEVRAQGTYTVASSGGVTAMVTCSEPAGGTAGAASITFSRDAPDRARMYLNVMTMMGASTLQLDLQRR